MQPGNGGNVRPRPQLLGRAWPARLASKGQAVSETRVPSVQEVSVLAETFRLLGDPTRLRILFYCLDGPKPVNDIAASLDLSQTLVSHHLRLLRAARLMKGERRSKQVFYQLADCHVSDMLTDMAIHMNEEDAEQEA
ncbi:winged helix-turn-helix transcriptional regulator [Aquamicrobium sp. cd-1]|uniref:Winged helix-turn-helix transcriptional regulator n=1 Tax=Aquamicrobium zhengzhouense TaxID=2781738 RepID=A0ABS0SE51_9HYPH|nr:winged helix-turn-helix transcriptional regulator [Aquamicrobium zhengzhouense]